MPSAMKLINAGRPAIEAAAAVMKTARPLTVPSALGPVELKPGTIWSGNKILIQAELMTVYSMTDDRIYEWSTGAFIQEEWLSAMGKGMASAAGWVTIAEFEMAVVCGIFAPWYVMLGMSCAKAGLFYVSNKATVNEAFRHGRKACELLAKMRERYPTLFRKIELGVLRELFSELKQGHGITAEDVGFFLGRIVKGLRAAPEVTIALVIKTVVTVGSLVAATHLPSIAAHAGVAAARHRASELSAYLRSVGYSVTLDEAKQIMREITADPGALKNMKELEMYLRALLPSLRTLRTAVGSAL